jgi:CheY-like chemotaxis protein
MAHTNASLPHVPRVLVCDDAPGFRLMLGLMFREAGWEVEDADSYVTALEVVQRGPWDAILADIWMPEPDMASLAALRAAAPGATLAVMSSLELEQARALVAGVDGIDLVLSKRTSPDDLVDALQRIRG